MIQRLRILRGVVLEAKVSYRKKKEEREKQIDRQRPLASLPDNWKEVSDQLTVEGHSSAQPR